MAKSWSQKNLRIACDPLAAGTSPPARGAMDAIWADHGEDGATVQVVFFSVKSIGNLMIHWKIPWIIRISVEILWRFWWSICLSCFLVQALQFCCLLRMSNQRSCSQHESWAKDEQIRFSVSYWSYQEASCSWRVLGYQSVAKTKIRPWKLTWNIKMVAFKKKIIFQTHIMLLEHNLSYLSKNDTTSSWTDVTWTDLERWQSIFGISY